MLTTSLRDRRGEALPVRARQVQRPKVLHLITWLQPGGIERWLLEMLRQIPQAECAMDVCCKGPDLGVLAGAARDRGAVTYLCPLTVNPMSFANQLSRILKEGGYNILHNHLGAHSGLPVWIARRAGVRVMTSYHNTRFAPQTLTRLPVLRHVRALYGRLSVGYAVGNSDVVTGCSQGVLTSIAGAEATNDRCRVLYYGIPTEPAPASRARHAIRIGLGFAPETPLVLHVGRFLAQKNHLGLLEIWKRVLTRTPTARLLLVGDGPLRPTVERALGRLKLGGTVRFLGVRADVNEIMGGCDVFLFPSLHEGLPMSAIEANGAGLPVVGTDVAGINEVVANGETGLLHPVEDVDGMASSVSRLLEEKERARNLGAAGRKRVRERFSAAVSARRLLGLYHECLGLG